MQKKIIALAIAAAFAAPVAMADTANVNVYGSLDAGVRNQSGPNVATTSSFTSGIYNSNRWGIKGTEDMGDGMKAGFGLEGDVDISNGGSAASAQGTATNLFARNATIFVESGLGKLELGRQYSVAFKTIGTYDPFGFKFIGLTYANAASITNRYDRDISYTGKFGEITVMAEHAMDNSTTVAEGTTGAATAVGVNYASGDITVAGAYSKTKSASKTAPEADTTYYTVGAAYKLGDAKVFVGLANNTVAASTTVAAPALNTTDATTRISWIGASYAVSNKIGVTAGVYRRGTNPSVVTATGVKAGETFNTLAIVGATYALSKRTTAYFEMDATQNDVADGGVNTAAINAAGGVTTKGNGTSIGLATTF